jgi:hypothetical protein
MRTRPTPDRELARIAGMIGDPTRATMLGALLGGEALPAGELARRAGIAPATATSIRFARTCYDHLAGVLGVMVTERLLERQLIVGSDSYEVTDAGAAWLESLGIDLDELGRSRRVVARPCLDWTERRDHLAGGAGAAIASMMLERRWITRVEGTRAVRLTLRGREGLFRTLGLECEMKSGN